jgi:2-dehydropantoate 2-reductase
MVAYRSHDTRLPRILVIGAGAVGCYFGGQLAVAGIPVAFVARGSRRDTLAEFGFVLEGPRGRVRVAPVPTYASAAEGGARFSPDVILLCVKSYDVPEVAGDLGRACFHASTVIALQNGIDAAERFARFGGPAHACVAGIAYVSAVLETANLVRYTSDMSELVVATFPDAPRLASAATNAGFSVRITTDIRTELWKKFVLLATNAALTSLARSPAGRVYSDPDMLSVARAAISEAVAVARAEGVVLPADTIDAALQKARNFPHGMYASMYHDLVAGRRIEIDRFSGEIVRLAERHRIDTPVHRLAYACLKIQAPSDPETNDAP